MSAAFFCFGITGGSLVPRMPAFKESLHITDGQIGLAFLVYAAGAVAGSVVARPVLARGARVWVRAVTIALLVALVLLALVHTFVAFAVVFLVQGVFGGMLDVLENSQAAAIEREAGRPMINGFHGFWSLGFMVGGLGAALAASLSIAPLPHFVAVALVAGAASVPLLAGVPDTRGGAAAMLPSGTTRLRVGTAVAAVAAMAFFAVIVESAGGNWGPIYLRDFGKATLGLAAVVGVAFSVAMTIVRFTADRLTARTSPAVMAASGAVISVLGIGLAVAFPAPLLSIAGFTLVGAGCAVMVPLTFSAGANLGRTGTALAIVTAGGYGGSIVGPLLIGATADRLSLRIALLIPLAAAVVVLLTSAALSRRDATERME